MQKTIQNTVVIAIVMPKESKLTAFDQDKFATRYRRLVSKAFVNNRKSVVAVIEVGNGNFDFSGLLDGLETSYIAYALFIGQTVTKLDGEEERISKGYKAKSLTLTRSTQTTGIWGTFDGKFIVKLS